MTLYKGRNIISPTIITNGSGGGNVVTATNLSDSAISSGNKVWLEKNGQVYNIKDFPYSPNVGYIIYGNPTISNLNIASSFSTSNYLQTNVIFPSTANSWEFFIKIKPTSVTGTQFFISDTQIYSGSVIGINYGKIIWYASTGASGNYNWDIINGITGTTTLISNTDYWLKFVFTGTQYICYLSTTGVFAGEESIEIIVNKSTKITGGYPISYGVQITTTQSIYSPFNGSIDLKETYIKINGNKWWSAIINASININDLYSGIAQENIAVNGSGSVKTILPS